MKKNVAMRNRKVSLGYKELYEIIYNSMQFAIDFDAISEQEVSNIALERTTEIFNERAKS